MGCGWLGLPLAVVLIKEGYTLRGTTTSDTRLKLLEDKGIDGFKIILGSEGLSGPVDEFLNGLDVLVINVPPGMRRDPGNNYSEKMKLLQKSIIKAGIEKVIFVSSTSVYGNAEGEIDEGTDPMPVTKSAQELVASETLFSSDPKIKTTIVRFGGLIGPDRHPVYMLSGRKELKNGNDALNLIHLDDCIHILQSIIKYNWWGEIFNGVYPDHPRKMDYYSDEARKHKLEPPGYKGEPGTISGKIVLSRNFLEKNQKFTRPIRS